MSARYTHLELGKDVETGIAGYYTPRQEARFRYGDKEVLYVTGDAVIESSCCGAASWRYAMVPGYVVSWQKACDEAGHNVSEVEPISDEATRRNLSRLIQGKEAVHTVEFW